MIVKTWPYGTKRKATLIDLQRTTQDGKPMILMMLQDDQGEGHILVGQDTTAGVGDNVTLTFTAGGPTGGFWKISP